MKKFKDLIEQDEIACVVLQKLGNFSWNNNRYKN